MSTNDPFRQFICRACGLIYDEALGDPDGGLPAGTRFEDIPDDWACPLCGVTKAEFEPHVVIEVRRATATAPRDGRARHDPGVVIVGAGRAGWQVAQALRELDPTVPLTLVSACNADVYDKPVLSVAQARGLAGEALVRESGPAAAQRLRLRLLPQTHAIRIDAAARQLRTTRGSLRYRHLVLAHGAAPRLPAALPPALVWRINHLQAYQRLQAALGSEVRHVLIVGAGLVGCELANDLALAGHGVTLLDLQGRPLAAVLPEQASQRLLEAWRALPLRFVGSVQVTRVQAWEGMTCVNTACGLSFEADQVIAATGLATERRLADSAGLAFDERAGGIAVEAASLRSSDPHIHALGDCIAVDGQASRYTEPIGRQAAAIAHDLAGSLDERSAYRPAAVPLRIKTGSLPITLQGRPAQGGRWSVDADLPDVLRMTQHVGGEVRAWLEARVRAA